MLQTVMLRLFKSAIDTEIYITPADLRSMSKYKKPNTNWNYLEH